MPDVQSFTRHAKNLGSLGDDRTFGRALVERKRFRPFLNVGLSINRESSQRYAQTDPVLAVPERFDIRSKQKIDRVFRLGTLDRVDDAHFDVPAGPARVTASAAFSV